VGQRDVLPFKKDRSDTLPARQMRISVCMAAHNGERFIRAQLKSILSQLGAQDEVIVVDDASTDGTSDCIRSFGEARILLIEHHENLGVLRTFESALRKASGDLLFLSDQDDLWAPNKVSIVSQVFEQDLDVDLTVSDAALIDENSVPLLGSYYEQRGGFQSGLLANVLHCNYLGCTMAFRRRVRDRALPFPSGSSVLHDLWIGASNALYGGKTLYIDQPLVLYRRHVNNATGNRRLTLLHQFRIRWNLCMSLTLRWLRWHTMVSPS
jgi:glycosyltransferase involved in cell wall biosynthesis